MVQECNLLVRCFFLLGDYICKRSRIYSFQFSCNIGIQVGQVVQENTFGCLNLTVCVAWSLTSEVQEHH